MTLAEIIANAGSNSEFVPGMSSNELFYGTLTDERLTDVIADVAEACQGKAASDHTHTGFAPSTHSHDGYAPADHSHNYADPTHSHTQSDITGLPAALDAKADLVGGMVPASQLPGYIDDVIEGHLEGNLFYERIGDDVDDSVRIIPETGKIYVDIDTNKSYRWSGSVFAEIGGGVALGETAATAYRGDRGKIAYDHSQDGNVHVTATQKATWDSKADGNHTHTGNVIVEQAASPYMSLKLAEGSREARVYKNASATADYGMTMADYDADGARDSLILCRNNALSQKLYLNVQNDDNTRSTYYLYGEHHKPTPAEIGAVPSSGGTITGETNFSGGLVRVNGVQTLYNTGTQLVFGSNSLPSRIAGSAITATKTIQVDSDERLKENIAPADVGACVEFINGIDVKTFNYIGNEDPCMGVIAQDIQDDNLAKFFVSTGPEGFLAVKAADLVFPLIAAVQALSKRVAELEGK